jgi:hypothetical protein
MKNAAVNGLGTMGPGSAALQSLRTRKLVAVRRALQT